MSHKLIAFILILGLAAATASIAVNYAEHQMTAPQSVNLYMQKDSHIYTLPFEEYILYRLLAECPYPLETEAMNAAAVAISSTALYRLHDNEKPFLGADFDSTTDICLTTDEAGALYNSSFDEILPIYKEAASYGSTHALTYKGEPIYAPMCLLSTGITEQGDAEWLTSVDTSRDKRCDELIATSAYNSEQVRLALQSVCPKPKLTADHSSWFTQPQYLSGGTLEYIHFGGCRISGKELAQALSLRGTAITVQYAEERFVFTTKGIGNNIGMSLYSADKMAIAGSSTEDILLHFYKDTELISI